MDTDKSQWGVIEWQAYALALEKAHKSALDGWGITVGELEAHSKLVAELRESNERMRNQLSLFQTTIALLPKSTERRGRGRPRKNTSGISDLDLFDGLKADYLSHHPNSNPSDKDVVTWSFSRLFVQHGMRASRATEGRTKGKIKTFLNRLSDARSPTLPKKSR